MGKNLILRKKYSPEFLFVLNGIIAFLTSGAIGFLLDKSYFLSSFLGGMVCIIPFFVFFKTHALNKKILNEKAYLKKFYFAGFVKFLLTFCLFAICFLFFRIKPIPFFVTFLFFQIINFSLTFIYYGK